MKMFKKFLALLICAACLMAGCVDQSGGREQGTGTIAATSVAVMEICDRLDLELVGVPLTQLTDIPEKYADATVVGTPMAPDMEILSQLSPEWVLSPNSLQSDLQPKYEAAGLKYGFLNLRTVFGMFQSIEDLGVLFDREKEAQALVDEFNTYYEKYRDSHGDQDAPRVLVLMGLPGSYVVATENSYVGSLVELAGGVNVYAGTDQEFLNVNTEDMLQKDPDLILRTAHALPDSVMKMFAEEFKTNDIWKHFSAVKNNRVYDLDHSCFGMSANFNYPQALEVLDGIFYGETQGGAGQ